VKTTHWFSESVVKLQIINISAEFVARFWVSQKKKFQLERFQKMLVFSMAWPSGERRDEKREPLRTRRFTKENTDYCIAHA